MGNRRDGVSSSWDAPKVPKVPAPALPAERRSPPPSDIKTKEDIRGKPPKGS